MENPKNVKEWIASWRITLHGGYAFAVVIALIIMLVHFIFNTIELNIDVLFGNLPTDKTIEWLIHNAGLIILVYAIKSSTWTPNKPPKQE